MATRLVWFTLDLVNISNGNEYPTTEKWRLCWGHLPSGFCLLFLFVVLYCFVTYFCAIGITILYVMINLLDILIPCMLGDLCEMSSIPELECT